MIEYQKITLMEMYNLLKLLLSLEEVYGVFRSQTQDEATRRRSSWKVDDKRGRSNISTIPCEMDNPFQFVLLAQNLGAGVVVCQSLFWIKYVT